MGLIKERESTVVLRVVKSRIEDTGQYGEQWIEEFEPVNAPFSKWTDNLRIFRDDEGEITDYKSGALYQKSDGYTKCGFEVDKPEDLQRLHGHIFEYRRHERQYTTKAGETKVQVAWIPIRCVDSEYSEAKETTPAGETKSTGKPVREPVVTITNWLKENGGGTNDEIRKGTGLKIQDVVRAINQLKKEKKVITEEGFTSMA